MVYQQAIDFCPLPEAECALATATCFGKPPRKGHKKSRRGCYECKRRKIKCQETRPRCDNCKRLSLRCRYLPDAASTVTRSGPLLQPFSALQTAHVFSMTDVRLFHHFLVAAWPHLPVRSDNIWLTYVVPIGHQCEYLMHAMMALSASHLEKLAPSGLTVAAQSHRFAAIKGLNAALEQPLRSTEAGDAAIATCYALLMQSWYMDDGLQASLVLTRSCYSTTKRVREEEIRSLLSGDDEGTRVAGMKSRLKDVPKFRADLVEGACAALGQLEYQLDGKWQNRLYAELMAAYESLLESPVASYDAYVKLDTSIAKLHPDAMAQLLDAENESSQLLLALFVAFHLVMRPISCRERKDYTVSFYGIRMSAWIPRIWNAVGEEKRELLEWPMWVSGLHGEGQLESWTLVRC